MRRFVNRQPSERTQLHDLRKLAIELFQPTERIVHRENGNLTHGLDLPRLVDLHMLDAVATFVRMTPPGVVDEDPADDLRRNAEEVRPVPPIDLPLIYQPQVGLMNQRRGLERVSGAFMTQLPSSDATQLRIDQWQQPVEGLSIAPTPIIEQRRDVWRVRHPRSERA